MEIHWKGRRVQFQRAGGVLGLNWEREGRARLHDVLPGAAVAADRDGCVLDWAGSDSVLTPVALCEV